MRQIAENAGEDGSVVVDEARGKKANEGFNALTGAWTDMFKAGVIDPANRTFQIEAEIRNNGGVLKPEMIARITLTREQRDAAIVVPQTAVIQDDQVSIVYLARDTGDGLVAERREVVTGPSYQGRVLIESGISGGEELITAGMLNVTTGDRLSIQNR